MSCRGVHFALTASEVAELMSIEDEDARLEHLQEEIETHYFEEAKDYLAESDKAWDAMHRTLADGLLSWDGGDYPLNHTVLAGELLYTGDNYIMSLKTPEQVQAIAQALAVLNITEFRQRYDQIDADNYCDDLSDADFEYTWEWFQHVRKLYAHAAIEKRYVLFTVDQ
ncbi:YfbM family protein [Undibacterium sp. Di27W]|uniref:YfbM family protein n=1 Tax=Undibacterium sp. Di27W TaxID=3413036 RepID=UPI003BEFC3FC